MISVHPTVKWLYAAENDGGGISAWKGNGVFTQSYVEVTGYLLPTMLRWNAGDLALRCADWLLTQQNGDGSYNGLDGVPRPFDTAAVVEGLTCMFEHTGDLRYSRAAARAVEWMESQIAPEGYLYNSPGNKTPCVYNLRASAIIGNRKELRYWEGRSLIGDRERSHYLAYAIEGLLNFGAQEQAMPLIQLAYNSGNRLQPFYVDFNWSPHFADFDICASAQMAILFYRVGLDAERHYAAVKHHIHPNGGVPQSVNGHGDSDARELSWGAKYLLDLAAIMEGVKA